MQGIEVIYTKENVTADMAIERLTAQIPKHEKVYVATSDRLQQETIWGKGAFRISAIVFLDTLFSISVLAVFCTVDTAFFTGEVRILPASFTPCTTALPAYFPPATALLSNHLTAGILFIRCTETRPPAIPAFTTEYVAKPTF